MKALALAVLLGSIGCATVSAPNAETPIRQRGAVVTRSPSTVALVKGPALLHAYSEFGGGVVFVAPGLTGTDADCTGTAARASSVGAERQIAIEVRAGEVACLTITARQPFELTWHSHANDRPVGMLASSRR